MEDWLEEEKGKYLPQLEAYAELMRKVHGDWGFVAQGALFSVVAAVGLVVTAVYVASLFCEFGW